MKVEWRVMVGIGVFVLPFAALYWVTSYEPAGSVVLAFFIASLLYLGGWLFLQARRTGPRPEDRTDAGPDEGDQVVGWFPDRSIWPLVVGIASAVIGLGVVFGRWVALPGVVLLAVAVVAYARESHVEDGAAEGHGLDTSEA